MKKKLVFGCFALFAAICAIALAARISHAASNPTASHCQVFQRCTTEEMNAFLEDVCPVGARGVEATTTTTTLSEESTTTTTLQRCEPSTSKIDCQHYNKYHTRGFNCDVTVNGKRGHCRGYRYRKLDGVLLATGCNVVVY